MVEAAAGDFDSTAALRAFLHALSKSPQRSGPDHCGAYDCGNFQQNDNRPLPPGWFQCRPKLRHNEGYAKSDKGKKV